MTYCYGLLSILRHPTRMLTSSFQELQGQSLPNLVCSICGVRKQEILNFITSSPKMREFWGKECKIDVFSLKIFLSSMGYGFRHIKNIVILIKEGSTKYIFHNPWGRGSYARHSHKVKVHYFSKNRHQSDHC